MVGETIEKNFSGYPKFFVKVDNECETVIFDCLSNKNRKSACKKHNENEGELQERIASCLLSYACKSRFSEKRAQMIAVNCMKHDSHFKHLGFMGKDELDAFMLENFAPLCEVKPKAVSWRRFLLDVGAVYTKQTRGN